MNDLEKALKKLKNGIPSSTIFLFEFRVGNEFLGFTDLEVFGRGQLRIKSTSTKKLVLYWKSFTKKSLVRDLLRTLINERVWKVVPNRMDPYASECPVDLTIRINSRVWQRRFWIEDMKANPSFMSIHRFIAKSVKTLTKTRVVHVEGT